MSPENSFRYDQPNVFARSTVSHSVDDRELRLQCLGLALRAPLGDPLLNAAEFYAFVTGAADRTAKQIISDALEAAGVT